VNEILDAAENLFLTKGYDETTVSDIVKAIDVAHGTFYNYFASKEAVVEALAKRQFEQVYAKIDEIAHAKMAPPEKIERIVSLYFTSLKMGDGWAFYSLYFIKHLHIVNKFANQAVVLFNPMWTAIIEEGNRQGVFHVERPDEVMDFISAIIQCLFHTLYQQQADEELARRLQIAGRMLDGALGMQIGTLHLTI
jgi:Transcriptional regulator